MGQPTYPVGYFFVVSIMIFGRQGAAKHSQPYTMLTHVLGQSS
jgi:hypothetical protein